MFRWSALDHRASEYYSQDENPGTLILGGNSPLCYADDETEMLILSLEDYIKPEKAVRWQLAQVYGIQDSVGTCWYILPVP